MRSTQLLFTLSLVSAAAESLAANPEAGKASVDSVCSSCHGIKGISASPAFPNLAGQKEDYLRAALTAYRDGSRKAAVMNALAANLSDQQIADVAAYLSSLKRCEQP